MNKSGTAWIVFDIFSSLCIRYIEASFLRFIKQLRFQIEKVRKQNERY